MESNSSNEGEAFFFMEQTIIDPFCPYLGLQVGRGHQLLYTPHTHR